MIARMNLGGPAHQVSLLSGRRFDPGRYDSLLVHGELAPGEESMADLAEREGARLLYLPSLGQPVRPGRDLRALGGLIRIIRRFRPHIVHTHTAKAGFLGRQAALAVRPRPVILHTFHGHVLRGYFGPVKTGAYLRLERHLGRQSDRLIGVSRQTVQELVDLGVAPADRFRVIRLGLDLSGYDELPTGSLRSELGLEPDAVLAVFVGRVVPIKRLDILIEAAARAGKTSPLHLAIVGDGEIRAELEGLAATLGVAGHVHFLGYRRDLPAIFAAADLAVLSSDNEGTPVSLIEAAAAGLPVAATDVGGVREVVTDEMGVLVPARQAAALGDAIAALASDPQARASMGEAGRRSVLRRYSADRLVADVEDLYEEVLAQRR